MKFSSLTKISIQLLVLIELCLTGSNGFGQTLDFSTSILTNWTITAGGAVNATPYSFGSEISVSSTGTGIGTFVTGGSFQNFDGYWLATYSFFLPANATSVSLTFSNLTADDRVLLTLNSTPLAATGIPNQGNGTDGSMVLSDGGSLQSYTFSTPNGFVSGTVTSGFNIGGENLLQAIVNNTGTGITGADVPVYQGTSNDGTHFGVSGSITYTAVPEPSVTALICVAVSTFGLRRKWINSPGLLNRKSGRHVGRWVEHGKYPQISEIYADFFAPQARMTIARRFNAGSPA